MPDYRGFVHRLPRTSDRMHAAAPVSPVGSEGLASAVHQIGTIGEVLRAGVRDVIYGEHNFPGQLLSVKKDLLRSSLGIFSSCSRQLSQEAVTRIGLLPSMSTHMRIVTSNRSSSVASTCPRISTCPSWSFSTCRKRILAPRRLLRLGCFGGIRAFTFPGVLSPDSGVVEFSRCHVSQDHSESRGESKDQVPDQAQQQVLSSCSRHHHNQQRRRQQVGNHTSGQKEHNSDIKSPANQLLTASHCIEPRSVFDNRCGDHEETNELEPDRRHLQRQGEKRHRCRHIVGGKE